MKKILSIFSIGVILGSGTIISGGGIACRNNPNPPSPSPTPPTPPKPTPKETFYLNSIKFNQDIVGLTNKARSANEPASITINAQTEYSKIEAEIISQYNLVVTNHPLTNNDFAIDSSTPTNKKPWAIKLVNGEVNVSDTTASDLQVWYNKGLASKTNSLSVQISTNASNVYENNKKETKKIKTFTTNVYFHKYIFNNQDVNNNQAIDMPTNGKTSVQIGLNNSNTLNFEQYFGFLQGLNVSNIINQWNTSNQFNLTFIYNSILNQVNAKFDSYMALNKSISKIQGFESVTSENRIAASKLLIFDVNPNNKKITIDNAGGEFARNRDVYIGIPVFNWNYLTNNNYFSNSDTYVYAYLGNTSEYSVFNISNLRLNNNDIAQIENKKWSGNEPSSIQINGALTYTNIANDIISQYNNMITIGPRLQESDFALDSTTLSATKSWALKIVNGDVEVKNTNPSDLKVWYNKGLASKTNSLSVQITTSNSYVVVNNNNKKTNTIKNATINAYFNKYIFTTQDINNDDAIEYPTTGRTLQDINLNLNNVLDLSSFFPLDNTSVSSWFNRWDNFRDQRLARIYNMLINQINAKFDTYMIHPDQVEKIGDFTSVASKYKIWTSNTNFLTFDVESNNIIEMHPWDESYRNNAKVFFAIPMFDWNYLTTNNYFSNNDTYIYAYLGTTPSQ